MPSALLLFHVLFILPSGVLLTSCNGGYWAASGAAASKGIYHRVKPGQTLWSIARTYKVKLRTLRRANRLLASDVIRPGQQLVIPGATRRLKVASRCPCDDDATASTPRSTSKSNRNADKTVAKPPIPFQWPLQGTITRSFKPRGTQRHDGIDIAAPRSTPIRAAAAGKVIFSDWGPGGYGRLVIIRHTSNLVTVYAHNEANLVRVDQKVRKGARIATVGQSGRATGYHLHFEVRRKTVPVSPFKFISRGQQMAQVLVVNGSDR